LETQRNKEFQAFVDGRNRLNEQLDRLRADVDEWLATKELDDGPAMLEIATLAGLLETRKALLNELAEFDDQFLKYLLKLRSSHGQ
jgi:AraC-like DNA-binding protein